MKKLTLIMGLVVLAAAAAFAGGAAERVEVTGTVSAIETAANGAPYVTLNTADGEYRVRISQNELDRLGLSVGDELTVNGELDNEDDGPEIEVKRVVMGGEEFVLDDDGEDDRDDDGDDGDDSDDGDDPDDGDDDDGDDDDDSEDDGDDEEDDD